ncbi:gamma-aminobutyric acid type B receptor subunit 2-like [Glandiceps talaboti]
MLQSVPNEKPVLHVGALIRSTTADKPGVNEVADIAIGQALDFISRHPSILPDYDLVIVKGYINYTSSVPNEKPVLHIGVLIRSTTADKPGVNEVADIAIDQALDFISRQTSILPNYDLVIVKGYVNNTSTNEGQALHLIHDFIYKKPQMVVLFLQLSSMVSKPVSEVATYYNLVQLSSAASSLAFSNKQRYPLFTRMSPTDAALATVWEALFQQFKWKRIAIIYENVEIFTLMMKHFVSLLRSIGGYEILSVEHVESGADPVVQMQSLKTHDARIIVLLGYEYMSRKIMCQAYRSNLYGQKYVWMLVGWMWRGWYFNRRSENYATCTDEELLMAVNGYIGVNFQAYTNDFNNINFNGLKPEPEDIEVFEHMRSSPSLYYAGFCFDSMLAIALALNNSDKLLSRSGNQGRLSDFTYTDGSMAAIVKDAILNQEFFGVTGLVRMTNKSDRLANIIIQQKQVDEPFLVEVGSYDVANDEFEWSEESPLIWQGKVPPTDGVEEIYSSVSASGTLRILLNTMASAKPLLLSLGLSLAFGAIFMKTYRVFAIFKIAVGKFKKIHVGDSRLLAGVVAMVTFDIIISLSWIIVDFMSITTGILRIEASLLLFGVFLAWEIRSVEIQSLNESRQIALSIYVVALVSFISAPAQYLKSDDVTFVYAFTGFAMFGATTVVLFLAFVPKMIALRQNEDGVRISTMKQDTMVDKQRSVHRLTDELEKKTARLVALKKLLKK